MMSTIRWRGGWLAALLILSASAVSAQERFRIDHFKVYDVAPVEVRLSVTLRGQFDRAPKEAFLDALTHLANPVRKDETPVLNAAAHLTFYRLHQEEREPERTVEFKNQFGEQEWVIGQPLFLLVPSLKDREATFFPGGLDHFKCYEVIEGKIRERSVKLTDQFKEEEAKVGQPRLFCVPVEKRAGDTISRINNPRAHLAFYDISPEKHEAAVWIQNQFGQAPLKVIQSAMIGVPSLKRAPEEVCIAFEDLPLGAQYTVGANLTDSGVTIHVRPFQWWNGQWTAGGHTEAGNLGQGGGSGQELWVNNVNLTFDLGGPISGLTMRFGEYGGNLNLMVNNDFQNFANFADINGATIGGVSVSVTNGLGNDQGTLTLNGNSDGFFTVGGQELVIDDVCFQG
jgi:hypothetical protein